MSLMESTAHRLPEDDSAPENENGFAAALLAKTCVPVLRETPCGEVFDRFVADPELSTIAVVDRENVPVGLVSRNAIAVTLAKPLMIDLYRRRPIRLLMEHHPMVVDADVSLSEVSRIIAREHPAALSDGFIITDQGAYYGVATAMDLMSTTVAMAELRAWQREEARREAEAANRAKTAFLANASHEIRTPLNAIMGFAEILQQEVVGPLGSDLYREYANDIVASGQHLMELINDLLDLSKAEVDRLELNETIVEVPRVVVATTRLLTERATRYRVAIVNDVPRELPTLLADERKLRQMLLNLLSNAVKYTPEGGTVTVRSSLNGHGLALSVHDTGLGMTPEEQREALEPWSRVNHALNRRLVGTGLGLPLTKRLVELHGGRLTMESAPGIGTTVTLRFPAERLADTPPCGASGAKG